MSKASERQKRQDLVERAAQSMFELDPQHRGFGWKWEGASPATQKMMLNYAREVLEEVGIITRGEG